MPDGLSTRRLLFYPGRLSTAVIVILVNALLRLPFRMRNALTPTVPIPVSKPLGEQADCAGFCILVHA